MKEQERETAIPQRTDGTFKAFWYDPNYPGHIMHRRPCGDIHTICVGHHHG